MAIPLEKAKRVLKSFRENNFNATKALKEVGYSSEYARTGSKNAINSSIKAVAKAEMKEIVNSRSPINKLLEIVGMNEGELINEYMFIIKQNKDLTNKLKALQPLLATQGIKWNEEQVKIATPALNITMTPNADSSASKQDIPTMPSVISDDDNVVQ